jgi:hypothetical protein
VTTPSSAKTFSSLCLDDPIQIFGRKKLKDRITPHLNFFQYSEKVVETEGRKEKGQWRYMEMVEDR